MYVGRTNWLYEVVLRAAKGTLVAPSNQTSSNFAYLRISINHSPLVLISIVGISDTNVPVNGKFRVRIRVETLWWFLPEKAWKALEHK